MSNEEVKCAVRNQRSVYYHPTFQEKWSELEKFATSIGKLDALLDAVSGAAFPSYFGKPAKCFIYGDFAPHSLGFTIHVNTGGYVKSESGEYEPKYEAALSGGIIFHEPTGEWSVHT